MTSRRRGLRRGGKGILAERYFVRSGTVYLGTTQNMRCTVTDVERYRKLNKEDYLTGGVLRRDSLRFFVPEKGGEK